MNEQEVKFLTPGSKCLSCRKFLLVHHCDNGDCGWLRCTNERCTSLFDVGTGRYSTKKKGVKHASS